jgi:uncharacterized protein (UPF0147 family)
MSEVVKQVIEHLEDLQQESDMNKRFKEKAAKVVAILSSDVELALEKAINEMEELNSVDMQSYHRTQVWDVISMLESAKQ